MDAHIGATALRQLAYNVLQGVWKLWSHGYPLSIENLTLRTKLQFAAIINETDAIWDYYFIQKPKAKQCRFDPKYQLELYLVLTEEDFNEASFHRTSNPPERGPPPSGSKQVSASTTIFTTMRNTSTTATVSRHVLVLFCH